MTHEAAMASTKKSTTLSSLAAYGDDSEQDSDAENVERDERGGLVSAGYGEDDISRVEEDDKASLDLNSGDSSRNSEEEESETEVNEAGDGKEIYDGERRDTNELVAQFSERVRNMSPDEIRIPPEPTGRCSNHLQEKMQKLYDRKLHGDFDTNSHIQKKKEFRNPSIYEKLIQFCGIDELGTNYPKDMFDPHGWSEDSYYEALDAQKRKSKWDSAVPVTVPQPTILTTTATLPGVVSVTTTASGTKTTVISAVGTIVKKAKQ
ncbi:S30BP protein, partial [Polypterus senegalus]